MTYTVYKQKSKDSDTEYDITFATTKLVHQLTLQFDKLQDTIYAKMVQKVGTRRYWEQWAKDVADIADRHVRHITELVNNNDKYKAEFETFVKGLQKQLNPSITKENAIEMLAQHLITRPVFEALFENYSFAQNNPVSVAMQRMLDILDEKAIDKDQEEKLGKFYKSVQERIKNKISRIDNAQGKQKVIIELYDKFFKTAMPKTVEQLGIVYTPVEVVDFILQSVSDVLKKEFNRTLSDENLHILDPFTGTGTFITRLLQGGYIKPEDLQRKYEKEIHANEIVLLAYYIASINIENAYHDLTENQEYKPFEGICLTDTFQMTEYDEKLQLSEVFPQNSERVEAQKKCPLTVIVGNPPYSVGQKSENDNAKNLKYEHLDKRVADTYVKYSNAVLNKGVYDSYIKAFRWSSDRLCNNGGIIAYITNGGWLDSNGMDGLRHCLEEEFDSVYVFNLRGGVRGKSGDLAKKEGQNVFDIMTGVAITVLVKNPKKHKEKAKIHYYDIGDYLSRKEKFEKINKIKSVISKDFTYEILEPNEHNDWLNQRNELFSKFIPIESDKKFNKSAKSVFNTHAIGIVTGRDAWAYNYSQKYLNDNISKMIDFYNEQRKSFFELSKNDNKLSVEKFIDTNPTKISWTVNLKKYIYNNKLINKINAINMSCYRPFCKQYIYYDKDLVERPGLSKQLYPQKDINNITINITGAGTSKDFSTLMTNTFVDLHTVSNGQCFPLYWYEEKKTNNSPQMSLLGELNTIEDKYIRHDGITDFIHKTINDKYKQEISKEDIFYYVYGLLHSKDYREKFSADLKKMLPRIPLVDSVDDFWAFSNAGRDLAKLHLNYEDQAPLSSVKVVGEEFNDFKVTKMKFKSKEDKSEIIYNPNIRISNIPKEAYDYVVNGKSAIEWIVERYQITIDKASQIKNDPNNWAEEHNNPRYILDLLLSVISLSVATVKIVNNLPKLNFDKK